MFSLPVKIQDDSYSFDIAESEYDNQIAQTPTNVKGDEIKFKNYVCNEEKYYIGFYLQYTVSNNEQCLYIRYPNYTKFVIKHSVRLILPLIFASWCLPFTTPAVASQNIWTPFSILEVS
jgi:hypothetical protein